MKSISHKQEMGGTQKEDLYQGGPHRVLLFHISQVIALDLTD